MFQENEIVVLLSLIGVLVFFAGNRQVLRQFPAWRWFAASFAAVLFSSAATVIEGVFAFTFWNLLEHIGYAVSAGILLVWTLQRSRRVNRP